MDFLDERQDAIEALLSMDEAPTCVGRRPGQTMQDVPGVDGFDDAEAVDAGDSPTGFGVDAA